MRPTQPLLKAYRKFRLTTKDINKGYYKGNRSGSMGSHTKHGGYILDYKKVRTYVVPADLDTFKLTPFVSNKIQQVRGSYTGYPEGPKSAELYLSRWKAENGLD
ncbi:mitochondrial ribosomal protein L27-domain-containing protein [Xylariaceae sp. FL0255]|nr:mitochondrial ribosomal protein L27-domain-containing protein [Xylariaceae sp. FL0255]